MHFDGAPPHELAVGSSINQAINQPLDNSFLVVSNGSLAITGRVAQVSLERTLGTITGGTLGFFVYVVNHNIDSWGDQVSETSTLSESIVTIFLSLKAPCSFMSMTSYMHRCLKLSAVSFYIDSNLIVGISQVNTPVMQAVDVYDRGEKVHKWAKAKAKTEGLHPSVVKVDQQALFIHADVRLKYSKVTFQSPERSALFHAADVSGGADVSSWLHQCAGREGAPSGLLSQALRNDVCPGRHGR